VVIFIACLSLNIFVAYFNEECSCCCESGSYCVQRGL